MNQYEQQIHSMFARILNDNLKIGELMEFRSKIGLPLYYCCLHSPINTAQYLTTVLKGTVSLRKHSLILVAAATFCYQYLPKSQRMHFMREFSKTLPIHAVPSSPELINSFGSFYSNGGAELIPCKPYVFKAIVTSPDPQINASPKLIIPFIENDTSLSSILYSSRNDQLTTADLFLFGRISKVAKLPKPESQTFCANFMKAVQAHIQHKEVFYDMECALMCTALLISWNLVQPDYSLMKISNSSLRSLAISGFTAKIVRDGLSGVPKFPETNDPIISTAYLRLTVAALSRPDVKEMDLPAPHWLVSAIQNEFHSSKSNRDIILQSPSIYDLSIEDVDLLVELSDFLPAWLYVHVMRMKTSNRTLAKSCMRLLSNTPEAVLNRYFDDFLNFIDQTIEYSEISEDMKSMLVSLMPAMLEKLDVVAMHFLHTTDFFSSENVQVRLNVLMTFMRFSKDLQMYECIFAALLEAFDFFTLTPSLINCLFLFFAEFASQQKACHQVLLDMALAVASSPFYEKPPSFVKSRRNINLFEQSRRFFKVISSDIVAEPKISFGRSFPPLPAALHLIGVITDYDHSLDKDIFEVLLHGLSLCPLEAVLAAKIIPAELKQPFVDAVNDLSQVYTKPSFLLAAEKFTGQESTSIISYDGYDDMRVLFRSKPDFAPLLLQYPKLMHLVLERDAPNVFSDTFKCATVCKMLRYILKIRGLPQPPISRKDSWTFIEFGDGKIQEKNFDLLTSLPTPSMPVETAQACFDNFRIRYPASMQKGSLMECIVQAIKQYRKRPSCRNYLYQFFVFHGKDVVKVGGSRLWLLQFGVPVTLQFEINDGEEPTDKTLAFYARANRNVKSMDDESGIYIELMRNGKIPCDSISSQLLFEDKGEWMPPYVSVSEAIHKIRLLKSYLLTASIEDVNSKKANIIEFLQSLDLRNPIIINPMQEVAKAALQRMTNDEHFPSFVCSIFTELIISDSPVNAGRVYDCCVILNDIYQILGVFDGAKAHVKKFCSNVIHAGIDVAKLDPLKPYSRRNTRLSNS